MVNNTQEKKLLKRKQKALSTGNQSTLAATCIDLGDIYIDKQRYEEAIQEFMVVADVYKSMGKLLDYGCVCRRIGEAYLNLLKYEKALEYQQIYLEIAKEHDKMEEQRAFATIGHVYLTQHLNEMHKPHKDTLHLASKAFMKSLAICESLTNIKKHQHKDMIARLLSNLGVVHECKGEYSKAIELLEKSISICKSHDLFEQLERAYTCLGTLYCKKKAFDEAIQQYNLAMEVAERLSAKVPLMCASLQAKADILIRLADFYGAKTELIKAYKLKHPIASERENIEQNLKTVAVMCKVETELLTTGISNHQKKKELYEKLGDGACSLKNFACAIDYYHKMLEAAKLNNETGGQLCPCYISLAETYRDDKQYDQAIQYYREDLNCESTKERISTLLSIADCMELGGQDLNEIENTYKQAFLACEAVGDAQLKLKTLTSYIAFLKKHGRFEKVKDLQYQLDEMDVESDNELVDEQITPNIGDDISIHDITDISDGSDTEIHTTRKRTKVFTTKRNNKGETQLHTACINGNLELVKQLLNQRHPVNVRDNCGWLPIHEACICGHLEIVQLLIDKGAAINDRGGTLCQGITPLHDAALNGHLEVVQLLLDNGVSSTARSDNGEIPLQVLKAWRSEAVLEYDQQVLFNTLVKRLTEDAEKLGLSKDLAVRNENSAIVTNAIVQSPIKREPKPTKHSQIGNLRKNLNHDDHINLSKKKNLAKSSKTTDDYKRLMESMRHPTWDESKDKKRKSNETNQKSAYVETDDWLENDVTFTSKKRKTGLADEFVNTTYQRCNNSIRRHSSSSSHTVTSAKNDEEMLNNFFDSVYNFNDSTKFPQIDTPSTSNHKKSRKKQTSLMDSGFTRHSSFESINSSISNKSFSPKKSINSGYPARGSDSFSADLNSIFNAEPTLSVDVRIDGKLYKVPVPGSELHTRTIKWLADEAALRYSRKECMKPDLELETKNGAVLADDDFISVLFSAGLTHAEEVEARIKKWNLLPLAERYTEACVTDSIEPAEKIISALKEVSILLNLSNLHLGDKILSPLCRVINRQTNLRSLNLSGNLIHNNCFQLLCTSLPTLDNLSDLNLSSNQLTFISLQYLTEAFTQSPKPILTNLVSLDLNHNPLENESFNYICIITKYLKLKTLNLVDVDFTKTIFMSDTNLKTDPDFEFISNFDISYNQLGNDDIAKFLSWLKVQNIKALNISSNTEVTQGLLKITTNWMENRNESRLNLKTLNLSRSCATDAEILELLRHITHLQSLDLSYNANLTAITLRRLLQSYACVNYLNLTGCDEILKYFESGTSITWTDMQIKELKISFDMSKYSDEMDSIEKIWKNVYKDSAKINYFHNFVHFSIVK